MRTVVGLYDRFEDAQRVVQALTESGIQRDSIGMVAHDPEGKYSQHLEGSKSGNKEDVSGGAATGAGLGAVLGGLGGLLVGLGALAIPGIGPVIAAGPIVSALAGAGIGAVGGGLLGALVDMGIPEEHANAYAEGVRRGGTLVYARVDDDTANTAADIMNRFNPIDINQRSDGWRQNQWSGFDQKSQPLTSQDMEMERSRYAEQDIPITGQSDVTLPVVEEEVQIGKRQVDRGGVRINSYTSERAVQEDINLRQERVNVERRPVNREATDADFNTFKEGSMEVRETGEEAVVQKRARVVEEVHVNKDVEQHTETINETVRRKDVDVENIGTSGTTGTGDWSHYEQMYRQDFQTRYGTSGKNYNYYMPAYRYGYDLRNNPRYSRYSDWSQAEPEARAEWQRRGGQTAWEDVKDAVRNAWESIRR